MWSLVLKDNFFFVPQVTSYHTTINTDTFLFPCSLFLVTTDIAKASYTKLEIITSLKDCIYFNV